MTDQRKDATDGDAFGAGVYPSTDDPTRSMHGTPYAPPSDKAVRCVGKRGDALKKALKRAEDAKKPSDSEVE